MFFSLTITATRRSRLNFQARIPPIMLATIMARPNYNTGVYGIALALMRNAALSVAKTSFAQRPFGLMCAPPNNDGALSTFPPQVTNTPTYSSW